MKFSQHNTRASKLTAVQVIELRQKWASGGYTLGRLAREYGVTTNTIARAVHGETWQHIPLVASKAEEQTQEKLLEIAARESMERMAKLNGISLGLAEPGGEPPDLPHEYGPSRVGHGEAQCIHCGGTNRENMIISPNVCLGRGQPPTALQRMLSEAQSARDADPGQTADRLLSDLEKRK